MASWASAKVVRNLWLKFWRDAQQLPRPVWRRWAGTLALGFGLCAPLTLAITLYARAAKDRWLQGWDETWLPVIAEASPLTFSKSITWESPGNLLVALSAILVFVGIMVWRSQPLVAATTIAAYGAQFALVWIGWGLWNRERPTLIAGGIASPELHSFPSGHTVIVLSVYGFMAYLWGRSSHSLWERLLIGLLFVGFASQVISARLVLGAHWPSDVVVGLIIGLLWLMVVIVAYHRAIAALRVAR